MARSADTLHMSTQKKNDHITIRVEPDVKAELEMLARKDDRTLSAYVVRLIKNHLQQARKPSHSTG